MAAEEGEVGVAAEGVGGAFGYLRAAGRSSSPGAHRGREPARRELAGSNAGSCQPRFSVLLARLLLRLAPSLTSTFSLSSSFYS